MIKLFKDDKIIRLPSMYYILTYVKMRTNLRCQSSILTYFYGFCIYSREVKIVRSSTFSARKTQSENNYCRCTDSQISTVGVKYRTVFCIDYSYETLEVQNAKLLVTAIRGKGQCWQSSGLK